MAVPAPGTRVPDYVAIGHLTIDRTPEGERLGGTAFYAALAAARFGARVAVFTRADLERLPPLARADLEQLASEVEIVAQASDGTTTFTNREEAGRRVQTLHAWGGEIDLTGLPALWRSAAAIHLAPVAQEIDARALGRLSPGLLGCTPQGWLRGWDRERFGIVRRVPLRLPADVSSRLDIVVLSSEEAVQARDVVDAVGRAGLSVVTRGEQGARVVDRGRRFDVPAFRSRAVDPVGAGDVFAGVLIAARAAREGVSASLRYASAAAALCVTASGPAAIPHRAEIEAFVEAR